MPTFVRSSLVFGNKEDLVGVLELMLKRLENLQVLMIVNVRTFLVEEYADSPIFTEGNYYPDAFHTWDDVCIFLYNNCKNVTLICQKMNDHLDAIRHILETENNIGHCNLSEILRVPNEIKYLVNSIDDKIINHPATEKIKKVYYKENDPNPKIKIRRTWVEQCLGHHVELVVALYIPFFFLLIVWDGSWTGKYYLNAVVSIFTCLVLLVGLDSYNIKKRQKVYQLCDKCVESIIVFHYEVDYQYRMLRPKLIANEQNRQWLIQLNRDLQHIFSQLQSMAYLSEKSAKNLILATNRPSVLEK
ncbi:uncharacterized protein EV154DRAFT_530204 [Mucor mucedo]|uniref:uncharacterized protein n=1 Tax=Mucor mucedo TaxID=29922 RepID=UPI00221E70EE|nr:uncharacterized protein EV154DRAFT_530204 [Mucor mucedo]KAI7870085.1 hypothetical protein EV154DRAFT_530204 [Mucor mucedo]